MKEYSVRVYCMKCGKQLFETESKCDAETIQKFWDQFLVYAPFAFKCCGEKLPNFDLEYRLFDGENECSVSDVFTGSTPAEIDSMVRDLQDMYLSDAEEELGVQQTEETEE